MKIDVKNFKDFLTKATLKATIQQALIKIEDKKMYISMLSADNVCGVQAKLKNVDSVDAVWGIQDTRFLLDCLDYFSGTIELKQEENKLYIFNKETQVEIVLASEEFIGNVQKKPLNLTYEKKVLIPTAMFKSSKTIKEKIKGEELVIESNEKQIIITIGNKSFNTVKQTINVPYINAKVKFNAGFKEIMEVIGDKAEIGLKSDYPAQFKEDTTEYEIVYFIAPRVSNVEE